MAAIYLIWGSTYLAIRIMVETIPPVFSGAARYLLAGVLFFIYARWWQRRALPTPHQWRDATLVGALLFLAGNGGVAIGAQYLSSSNIAITIATMPLWTALFARFAGRRLARLEWWGMALGVIGVALLHAGGAGEFHAVGLLAVVASTIGWAAGSVLVPRTKQAAGAMAPAAQMLTGGALMLMVSLALGEEVRWPSLASALAFLYLLVFGTVLAFSAYTYLLHRVSPALATSNAYVNPIVAVALGTTLGAESFGAVSAVALLVVLTAVGFIAFARRV